MSVGGKDWSLVWILGLIGVLAGAVLVDAPPEQHASFDIAAYHVIGAIVWGIIGAVIGAVVVAIRK